MTIVLNYVHRPLVIGPVLLALAACPQKDPPATTDAPEGEDTTADASTSNTTAVPTSSGSPGTTTDETSAPSVPDTTSTSTTSESTLSEPNTTTTLDPGTTTGSDACRVDLAVALAVGFEQCDDSLVLIATVQNVGTVAVPAGVDVAFYAGTDASGVKLVSEPIVEALPAGGSTDVVRVVAAPPAGESRDFYVEVDSGPRGGVIVECDEDNNSALVAAAACPD